MSGDEKAKNFLLRGQARMLIPVRNIRKLSFDAGSSSRNTPNKPVLTGLSVALRFLRAINGFVQDFHQLSTTAHEVHRAAFDQRFKDPFV